MPIYEFECSACEKDFQTYTPTMKWDHVRCPKCGSAKVEKKLSRFAVIHGEGVGESEPACSGDPSNCGRCDFDD